MLIIAKKLNLSQIVFLINKIVIEFEVEND